MSGNVFANHMFRYHKHADADADADAAAAAKIQSYIVGFMSSSQYTGWRPLILQQHDFIIILLDGNQGSVAFSFVQQYQWQILL